MQSAGDSGLGLAQLARNALVYADLWLCRHLDRAPRTLPILVIMFTDKCNLRCKMCGACDYSPGDHGMLSLEEWKRVIDSAARLRTQGVEPIGGTPAQFADLITHELKQWGDLAKSAHITLQ